MKKTVSLLISAAIVLLCFAGCNKNAKEITFSAVILSSYGNSMSVSIADKRADFYSADVKFSSLDFVPETGRAVTITTSEIVYETPVQVTAKSIELIPVKYKKITADEAYEKIQAGGVTVVDVSSEDEFNLGHIAGAVLLTEDDIREKAEAVLPDKQAEILVYCRSGDRSEIAARSLISLGYTNVTDFGTLSDWQHGLTLE